MITLSAIESHVTGAVTLIKVIVTVSIQKVGSAKKVNVCDWSLLVGKTLLRVATN